MSDNLFVIPFLKVDVLPVLPVQVAVKHYAPLPPNTSVPTRIWTLPSADSSNQTLRLPEGEILLRAEHHVLLKAILEWMTRKASR